MGSDEGIPYPEGEKLLQQHNVRVEVKPFAWSPLATRAFSFALLKKLTMISSTPNNT